MPAPPVQDRTTAPELRADGAVEDPFSARGSGGDLRRNALSSRIGEGGRGRIVWCNEKCHKQECREFREAASATATQMGSALTCLRTVHTYAQWLARSHREPFVLLSRWREAKPCLDASERLGKHAWPLLTLVQCIDEHQVLRVRKWAQEKATSQFLIFAAANLGPPHMLVATMLEALSRLLSRMSLRAWPEATVRKRQPSPSCRSWSTSETACTRGGDDEGHPLGSQDVREEVTGLMAALFVAAGDAQCEVGRTRAPTGNAFRGMTPAVSSFVAPFLSRYGCAQQLEIVLRGTQRQVYED